LPFNAVPFLLGGPAVRLTMEYPAGMIEPQLMLPRRRADRRLRVLLCRFLPWRPEIIG
jgi:hypothetical protein